MAATPRLGADRLHHRRDAPPRVVAGEVPLLRGDGDPLVPHRDRSRGLAVLVEAAGIFVDAAAIAEEGRGLFVARKRPGEVQLHARSPASGWGHLPLAGECPHALTRFQHRAHPPQRFGHFVTVVADLPRRDAVDGGGDLPRGAHHVRPAVDCHHRVRVDDVAIGIAGHARHHARQRLAVESVEDNSLGPAQVGLVDVIKRGGQLMAHQLVVGGEHGTPLSSGCRSGGHDITLCDIT